MASKLGFPALSSASTGGAQMQAKANAQASPKTFPLPKKYPPPQLPADHSKLYEGADPLLGNANFEWLVEQGVSSQRPEIIAVTNFQPAYFDAGAAMAQKAQAGAAPGSSITQSPFDAHMTPVGRMLLVQLWSRELVAANMLELVSTLKSYPELSKPIADRESALIDALEQASNDADFLLSLAVNIERLRRAFDVMRSLSADVGKQATKGLSLPSKTAAGAASSPAQVMSKHLGFDENNVRSFTNTKMLQQLVFDLLRIVRRHSYTLFGAASQTRKLDASPIIIDRSPDVSAATLKFSLASLGSPPGAPRDATVAVFHKQLDDSLPSSLADRVKLLAVVVSRELRVSLGLGDASTVTSIAARYPAVTNVGDPFVSVIGEVGHTMTDRIAGPDQSLAALTQLPVAGDRIVLPFESSFINAATYGESGIAAVKLRLFIPGPSYFVDPIISGQPAQFDTAPLKSLASRIDRNVTSARDALGRLLQIEALADDPGDLFEEMASPRKMALLLFVALHQQLTSMVPKSGLKQLPGQDQNKQANTSQLFDNVNHAAMFLSSLAASAQEDFTLRTMLFRYVMLAGIIANNEGVRKGSFFSDLTASDELSITIQGAKVELSALIGKIVARMLTISGTKKQPGKNDQYASPDYVTFTANKEMLTWLLGVIATKSTSSTPGFAHTWMERYEELINAFNDMLNKGSAKFNGLTRRSSLSLSTVALLVFETFVSLIAKNAASFFVKGPVVDTLRVVLDATKAQSLTRAVKVVRSKIESDPALANGVKLSSTGFEQSKFVELKALADAISSDDDAIIAIMQVFSDMNDGVQMAAKTIVEKYTKGGSNAAHFRELQDVVIDAPIMIDRGQIVLARALVDEVIERVGKQLAQKEEPKLKLPGSGGAEKKPADPQSAVSKAMFIDDDIMMQGMTNALMSMLREPELRDERAGSLRILTVGIPAGFSAAFRRVVDTTKPLSDAFTRKQDDVVTISVYKKDEQYDGLVFKPQQQMFELTRFVLRTSDPPIEQADDFSAAVEKLDYRDYSLDMYSLGQAPQPPGADELFIDASYSFLTIQQRAMLRRNHAMSALMGLYVRLLTDLGLDEKTFAVNAAQLIAQRAESSAFLKNAANVHASRALGTAMFVDAAAGGDIFAPDTQLVQQATDFDQVQKLIDVGTGPGGIKEKLASDMQTFAKLFASRSVLSDGQTERSRLLAPKLFERVFNVVVDSNGFDIDEKSSDGSVIDVLTKQGIVEVVVDAKTNEKRHRMVRRSTADGHVTFEKYMVTIDATSDALPLKAAAGTTVVSKPGLGSFGLMKLGAS